jgi:hypothetical protein
VWQLVPCGRSSICAWISIASLVHVTAHTARTGAFRSFDINEAIKTSDRRIAEELLKNTVFVGEEPGVQ